MKKKNIIEITEDVVITQEDGTKVILEAGDKIVVQESMQREAFIFRAKDNKWYYFIAHFEYGEYPDGSFYGPFPSEDRAISHMMDNHSNPGGFHVDDSGTKEPPSRY